MTSLLKDTDYIRILEKYRALRTPPMIDLVDPANGLLDPQFFEAYQKQFVLRDRQSLGILVADASGASIEEKWNKADYQLQEGQVSTWIKLCRLLRSTEQADRDCKEFNRKIAIMMEIGAIRTPIAYRCHLGLFEMAIPILCNDVMIAVLFAGQFIPKSGKIWHPDMGQLQEIYRRLPENQSTQGIDLQSQCRELIRTLPERCHYISDDLNLIEALDEEINHHPHRLLSPEDANEFLKLLTETSGQITELCETAFFYEKSWLLSRLRSQIQALILPLFDETFSEPNFHENLSKILRDFCQYMALDVMGVIQLKLEESAIELTDAHGLDELLKELPYSRELSLSQINSLANAFKPGLSFMNKGLADFKPLPVFELLPGLEDPQWDYNVYSYYNTKFSHVLILLGKRGSLKDMKNNDREDLASLLPHFGQVFTAINLLQSLEQASEKEMMFLEEVAHDLRGPLQNIMLKTQALRKDIRVPKPIQEEFRKIGANAQRLDVLSKRTWTLSQITREKFTPAPGKVRVDQVIHECIRLLDDRAARKKIEIEVVKPSKNQPEKIFYDDWPPLEVDHNLFLQAFLNLLDNAIKYSYEGTWIKISGRRDGEFFRLDVENRGIPLPSEPLEASKIWRRGFRSMEAAQFVQEGAGLGLEIVKVFARYYGKVTAETLKANGVPLTLFSLYIKSGGVENV